MPALHVVCLSCHQGIKADTKYIGQEIKCPSCQAAVIVEEPDDDDTSKTDTSIWLEVEDREIYSSRSEKARSTGLASEGRTESMDIDALGLHWKHPRRKQLRTDITLAILTASGIIAVVAGLLMLIWSLS